MNLFPCTSTSAKVHQTGNRVTSGGYTNNFNEQQRNLSARGKITPRVIRLSDEKTRSRKCRNDGLVDDSVDARTFAYDALGRLTVASRQYYRSQLNRPKSAISPSTRSSVVFHNRQRLNGL